MEFIPFFLLLISAVIFSAIFHRFHLPWVLALIVAGVVIGPHGFSVFELNSTVEFMGQVGLVFLMFMAGLSIKFSNFKKFGGKIAVFSTINSLVPLVVGYLVGLAFGLGSFASVLLGVIFMSSSIAVVIPTLEASGISQSRLGRLIISSTVIEDIVSLLLLSLILQSVAPTTSIPLPFFYTMLLMVLVGFRFGLPKIRSLIKNYSKGKDDFESDVRIVFTMLLGTVVAFESLGLHPIIAGFFSGLVLSDSLTSEVLLEKLRTISYGLFIPIFFIIVGVKTDVSVFWDDSGALLLILVIVSTSMIAKLSSGFFAARFLGFSEKDSIVAGLATVPLLSTALAVVASAFSLGLLTESLATAMVALSIVSTLVAPVVLRILLRSDKK